MRKKSITYDFGLTNKQVNERRSAHLINKTKDVTKTSYFHIVLKNIFTFYNILLFGIGALLIWLKAYDNCFFLIIVLSNTILGLFQDIRAKHKLDNIALLDKNTVKIIRNGRERNIFVNEIVLGDVVHISSGEQVPCDSKVIRGTGDLDESILTGESLPLKKTVGDDVLSGSYVINGDIFIEVIAVGNKNYSNKIKLKTKEYKSPKSQLYSELNILFKAITGVVVIIGILTCLSKITTNKIFESVDILKSNIVHIAASIISMIPSGMYLLISTTLTVSTITLAKQKVVVQNSYSIETLARVDTLCIDKTGTLTDGNMEIKDILIYPNEQISEAAFYGVMASHLYACAHNNFTAKALEEEFGKDERIVAKDCVYFDSRNKYSGTSFDGYGTITVGAFGFVPLKDNKPIENKINSYTRKGLRVLIVGYSKEMIKGGKVPQNQELLGIIVLADTVRKNAKEIIEEYQKSGVAIKVISGDDLRTVQTIARQVEIKDADKAVSLEGLTNEEIEPLVLKNSIFARVTPEQKEFIIEVLKKNKKTVAMFGDGVNDLLALKASHVGITVGDANKAAKDISNIILYNNDFSALPSVIVQGRKIINNLQRVCSLYLIKTIFAILINIFFIIASYILKISYPFTPKNFYAWEIVTIGIATFFLALQKNEEQLVKGDFLKNIAGLAINNGVIVAGETMLMFIFCKFIGWEIDEIVTATTMFMTIASFVSLFEACLPLNLYRLFVFLGALLIVVSMYLISIFTPLNIVDWTEIEFTKAILAIFALLIVLMLSRFIWAFIKKIRRKKNG